MSSADDTEQSPITDPSCSQLCKDVKTESTDGEMSDSNGHITSVDQQNGGFHIELTLPEVCVKKEETLELSICNTPDVISIKEENADNKDHLYCEDCQSFFFSKCEVHGLPLFVPDSPVPMAVPDRARQTLPPGLEIQKSAIPDAGLGVFNKGPIVPVGAHYGPYQGELVGREEAMNSGYSWVIYNDSQCQEYIDGKKEMYANWMRYVNCARNAEEQNLVAFQYQGEILYRCCRSINPGQELLVWHAKEYPKDLDPTFISLWNIKSSRSDMSGKRKSYSVEYKKGIVEDSVGKNLTAFCKEKMLSIRLVRKWRADYSNLIQQVDNGNAKKRKCGSGRHPLFTDLEDLICEWIVDRRAKALVVSRAQIQEFALAMAQQFEIAPKVFKASQHWLDSFLQRSELSLRRSTTLFRLDDAEIIKRAFAFKSFIDDADFSKYNLSNMIAMDETAVFMSQASQTTIDQWGVSSVYIPSTAYESARVTCILAIRLDGTKVPPLIISKGKKDEIECDSGIFILETEKAWATQAVIRKWVDLMLPLATRESQRGLIVWDAASTHRAKGVKKFLEERKIDQIMIPAGMTAYLHSLDIAINKPFKENLHMEINDYIENRMERDQHGNFVKPTLQEVVTWVKNSWEKITESCIANALRAGYLDRRYSFKDSAIARHETFGPMILKEMESQELHQEIQGLDWYDDIPEDDDMTVTE